MHDVGGQMKLALVAALAASVLTGVTGSVSPADAATPCSVATTNRALNHWLAGAVSRSGNVNFFRFGTTSAKWTLIKLGNLNADLQLKLYDKSCRVLATSQHSGRHFEQIYRSLPAGRYYLGVSGVSGTKSTYDVKFAPLRDGVRVLSTHAFITSYRKDLLEVDGEVLNNLSAPNFFRYVNLKFYDRAGHVVAAVEGSFAESYVRARSRASFLAQLIKPRKAYVRYTVATVTQSLNGYPAPPRTKIVASSPWRDPQGNVHYPGRITNTSTGTIWLGSVQATLYNTFGNVDYVNSGVISPDQLAAKKTGRFDVEFGKPAGVNCAVLTLG
jgi:hypothetical protein